LKASDNPILVSPMPIPRAHSHELVWASLAPKVSAA